MVPTLKIVKTKSIPNVDTDRLEESLDQIHALIHVPEAIRAWDAQRRGMVDNGIKGRKIAAELSRRGQPDRECRFCQPGLFAD